MAVPETPARALRILIADDQPEVRNALRLLLDHEPGVEVVGEASDATTLEAAAAALRPDIVLLDWELPGLIRPIRPDGAAKTSAAASVEVSAPLTLSDGCCPNGEPPPRIIALSVWPECRQVALAAGAAAFASKGDTPEQLLAALRLASLQAGA